MLIDASAPTKFVPTAPLDLDRSLDDRTERCFPTIHAQRGESNLKRVQDDTEIILEPDDSEQSQSGIEENSVAESTGLSFARNQNPSLLANYSSQDEVVILPADVQEDENVFGGRNLGYLGLDRALGGSSGAMYQAFFSDGLNELSRQLSLQTGSADPPINPLQPRRIAQRERPKLSVAVLAGIPDRSQSNVLLRTWLSGFHVFYPLVDTLKVLDKYHVFWAWHEHRYTSRGAIPDSEFVPLLFAIWLAGSMCISNDGLKLWFPGSTRESLSVYLQDKVKECLNLLLFPKLSCLQTLAAFLTVLAISESYQDSLSTGIEIGLALRVAQSMGLHRDPQLFDLPPWEINTRRQIWWHIMQVDSALALATGLPVLVDDRDFWDTKSAAQVKDMRSNAISSLLDSD